MFIGALFASGQQPAAPAPDSPRPEAVFTVTSTLVQVDAVVTDSKGHHVTDLAPEDFQIFEDGKLQKLTHFSYVAVTPEHSATPQLQATHEKPLLKSVAALPPPPAAQLRREDVRRTIVLMVDDLGLSFESMAFVRASLRKFVNEQMQPGDLVAICRTGEGSGSLQQFSGDKRVLLSVIDGLHWNPNGRFGLSYFNPYGKFGRAEQLANVPSGAPGSLDVLYDEKSNALATVGTLGAVNYIIGALHELPGRKSIVLFSDGLQLFEAPGAVQMHAPGSLVDPAVDSYAQVTETLRRLIDRANRSGTVIYTMHTSGLQTLQLDAQDNPDLGPGLVGVQPGAAVGSTSQQGGLTQVPATNSLPHAGVIGGRDVFNNIEQQNLAYLADRTGGLAYDNGNDLNWGLERVLDDQAGYYLLGYHPPETTLNGKNSRNDFHHIQVKVTRAGLHARSRCGFFGETDDQALPQYPTPVEQLQAAMLSPFQSSGVGVRLTALYAEVPKQGPVVRNLLRINAANLSWWPDRNGGKWARLHLVMVATGTADQRLAAVDRLFDLKVEPEKMAEVMRDGALYTLDVPVPVRGAYQIRVAVRDEATAKVGSATQFVEIPDLKKTGFALTSVVLQDGQRPADDSEPGITPALRQFKPGSSLEFLCAVENGGKKGPEADLATRVLVVRDGREVYSGPARLIDVPGSGKAVFGALKLAANMTPGNYYLQVIAMEQKGAKAAGQWTDFTLVP
jgi:VWFA-related protein